MATSTPELIARFSARDENGNEYVLMQYVMVTQSGSNPPTRTEYILTDDRRLVRWIAEGEYRLGDQDEETKLFSNDPQAP
ncbi:hypothetical protein [Aureliella helgolandensis]|uniref:Uncharacterized protein n=1 Tax=Aureliella helgolandensis TaxID=2527968 RepID=A0A518G5J8_9BACT|nr:hypothetical protein [Aureliella helgolandensis]QDV23873.1 hypothetical protein Q31a_21820 [Aureliella helgolandensis]